MATTVRDILLQFTGDAGPADREIDDLVGHLRALDGTEAKTGVEIARAQFDAEYARILEELDRLGAKSVTAKVRLKLDDTRADVERIAADASSAFDRYFHAQGRGQGGMFTGLIRDAERLASDLEPVMRGMLETTADVEQLSTAADKGAGFFATFGDKISQIQPVAGGLLVILIVGMIPALVAVGASALAAVAGLAALATAFVGILLPAMVPVIAAISSVTGVLKALLERSNASKQAAANAGQAHQKAASQAMARRAAELALRDAIEARASAERHYQQAVQQAADQIVAARRAEKNAEADVAEAKHNAARNEDAAHRRTIAAQKALKAATIDAYSAWAKSVQDATDAELALEDAQLAVLDANDRLYTAQENLNKLLNQIPSDKIGDILKKLKDVNVPEDQAIGYIQSVGGLSESDAHKLYRAYLDLQHAQLGVREATNDATKAHKALAAAQAEVLEFTQKGVKAYGPYNDAVNALAQAKRDEKETTHDATRAIDQAQQRLAIAKKTLAEYVKEGVNGMPGVRDALDQVRNASQRVADAQYNLKHRADGATAALDAQSASARRAESDWKRLTPAQRDFGNALLRIRKELQQSGLGDVIVHGLATFIRGMTTVLKAVGPGLAGMMQGIGQAMGMISKAASGRGAQDFFQAMAYFAGVLAKIGARVIIDFAKGLAHVAEAATPALVKVMNSVADAVGRFAEWSGKSDGQRAIGRMIDATMTWGKAIGQVLGFFSRLIGLAAPFGNALVKSIGDWAGHLFNSKKGQDDVKRFFRDTIPFAKSLAGFVGAIIGTLVKIFQFAAPILKPFIDAGRDIVNIVGAVVGFLNNLIPGPVRAIAGDLLALLLGAPKLLGWLGKIPGVIGKIATWVAKLGIVDTILHALGAGVSAIGKAAEAIGKAIASGIVDAAKAAFNLAEKLASWVGDAVSDAGKWVADVGGKIVDSIWAGIKNWGSIGVKLLGLIADSTIAAAGTVLSVGGAVATWIANGLGAIAGWGKSILGAIGSAIKGAVKSVGSVGGAIADWIVGGIRSGIDFGGKILKWIGSAVSSAARSVASIGGKIVTWIWHGIEAAGSIGGKILRQLEHWIVSAAKGAASVGASIVNWIWKGIKSAGGLAEKVISALWHGVTGLAKLGEKWAGALWDGIKGLPGKIISALTGAWDTVTGWFSGKHLKITVDSVVGQFGGSGGKGHAAGGVATRAMLGIFGEEPGVNEALIPLKPAVLAQIGAGILAAMQMPTIAGAGAPALAGARAPDHAAAAWAAGQQDGDTYNIHTHTKQGAPDGRETAAAITHRQRQKGGSASPAFRRAA